MCKVMFCFLLNLPPLLSLFYSSLLVYSLCFLALFTDLYLFCLLLQIIFIALHFSYTILLCFFFYDVITLFEVFSHDITLHLWQAKSAMLLSSRKQFPPSDNPWKHVYDPEDRDAIDFKMWNSLIGIILMGTIMGWSASTYVPLLPGWLGALGSASFLGYSGTLKDSRGDVLR